MLGVSFYQNAGLLRLRKYMSVFSDFRLCVTQGKDCTTKYIAFDTAFISQVLLTCLITVNARSAEFLSISYKGQR